MLTEMGYCLNYKLVHYLKREKELLRRLERASDVVGGGDDIIKLNAKLLM